jgi:hypothetical protein
MTTKLRVDAVRVRLMDEDREGVVFKDCNAIYEPGRRESLKKAIAVKVKFWAQPTSE